MFRSRDDELGSASDLDCILRLAVLLILLPCFCLMLMMRCTIDSHSSIDQPETVQDEAPDAPSDTEASPPDQQASEPSPPPGLAPPPGLSPDAPPPDEPNEDQVPSLDERVTPAPVAKKPQSQEHKPTPPAVKDGSSVAKPDVVPQVTAAAPQETKSPEEIKSLKEKTPRSAPESAPAEKEPRAVSRRESRRAASAKAKDKTPAQSTSKSSTVEKAPLEAKGQSQALEKEGNAWGKKSKAGTLRISTRVPEVEEEEACEPAATKADSQPASSGPPTPGPGTMDSPVKRTAPRTLRITDAPKTETPRTETPPIPQAPIAPVVSSKVSSRRHSLTSNNQPGTPSSDQIDISSVPSASPSRATSPAPVVGKKRADKKAKKQKKKEEEEAQATAATLPAEEHSPVLSRMKKTRKPTGANLPSRTVSAATSTAPDVKTDEKADKPEPTKQESKKPISARARAGKGGVSQVRQTRIHQASQTRVDHARVYHTRPNGGRRGGRCSAVASDQTSGEYQEPACVLCITRTSPGPSCQQQLFHEARVEHVSLGWTGLAEVIPLRRRLEQPSPTHLEAVRPHP